MRRTLVFAFVCVLLGVVAAWTMGELWVRGAPPPPRRQLVRGRNLHLVGDVPIWDESVGRQHVECATEHPNRIRVMLFGSSITYGYDLDARETATTLLEDRLNALRPDPGFCVMNFAQSGFAFDQKYVVAQDAVARYRPAVILWEDWRIEGGTYRIVGDTAYWLRGYRLRSDGLPGLFGVPDFLNRWAFSASRLYQYLTIAIGESAPLPEDRAESEAFVREKLVKVPALAASVGAKLAFYVAPALDQPLSAPQKNELGWQEPVLSFASERGIPAYSLQHELRDQDYLAVRLDPCCHFNAPGHRAIEPVLERIVLRLLDAPASPRP